MKTRFESTVGRRAERTQADAQIVDAERAQGQSGAPMTILPKRPSPSRDSTKVSQRARRGTSFRERRTAMRSVNSDFGNLEAWSHEASCPRRPAGRRGVALQQGPPQDH